MRRRRSIVGTGTRVRALVEATYRPLARLTGDDALLHLIRAKRTADQCSFRTALARLARLIRTVQRERLRSTPPFVTH